MQTRINRWREFEQHWDGIDNFLIGGECVPFAWQPPALEQVIDDLRQDADVRITTGEKAERLDLADVADSVRSWPIEKVLASRFALAHFKLERFDVPGRCLHGLWQEVVRPWQQALAARGFTWSRCYPIVFVSGPGAATNYHMDLSHVLAWQIYGCKQFCSLKEPDRWAPSAMRKELLRNGRDHIVKPSEIRAEDTITHEMRPGDVLWNAFLTPHWVEASDQAAMSINLSHGGLRLHGRLCLHESELEQWKAEQCAPKAAV